MGAQLSEIDRNEGVVRLDGLDDAILGLAFRFGGVGPVLCYDVEKITRILMVRDGMTYEDAHEFFEFNIAGLWAGDGTPIFVEQATLAEIADHLEFEIPTE